MTKLAVFAYFPLQSMELKYFSSILPLSFNSSHSRNNNSCKDFFSILPQPHSEPRMLRQTRRTCVLQSKTTLGCDRVELPITEHFPIFSSLWSEVKEQHRKHTKTMSDSLLQFFWKHSSRLLYSSSPISSSFLVRFEWFKIWWVLQLGLYRTSFYSRSKDATIKDFKLEIQICFNPPPPPLTPKTPYLPHSFIELSNFCSVGSARWRANFLWSCE
jgi:hypothetical protein